MKRRAVHIPSRRPVFLGCEGESEQAYGQFVQGIVNTKGLPFHIEVVNLNPGAGDPLARVKRAVQEIERRRKRRSEFQYRALLMDDDQLIRDQQRREQVQALAAENHISIIWQAPCHEAFLLRHFEGRLAANPPDSAASVRDLRREWPEYAKPASRIRLARCVDFCGVKRVSTQHEEFARFLRFLHLIT